MPPLERDATNIAVLDHPRWLMFPCPAPPPDAHTGTPERSPGHMTERDRFAGVNEKQQ